MKPLSHSDAFCTVSIIIELALKYQDIFEDLDRQPGGALASK